MISLRRGERKWTRARTVRHYWRARSTLKTGLKRLWQNRQSKERERKRERRTHLPRKRALCKLLCVASPNDSLEKEILGSRRLPHEWGAPVEKKPRSNFLSKSIYRLPETVTVCARAKYVSTSGWFLFFFFFFSSVSRENWNFVSNFGDGAEALVCLSCQSVC